MQVHIKAALGEIRYQSYDIEAQFQLQLQLMSSTKGANKIKELKKKLEDAEMELETSRSLTDKLKEKLAESFNTVSVQDLEITSLGSELADLKRQISKLKLDLSIAEIVASEFETRHYSDIEAAKVAAVEKQKVKILKLRRKLASDAYNLYLKKMAKAYPRVNMEVLDHKEVVEVESEEFEDDEDPEAVTAS
ncbi:hypothetical protein F0562_017952 [Nyssa sinensis]|uniref:Uncharacterized protein n=1 Tax=Nyssa sinensis TaxID=561372 RepID=A0A5J4Z7Y2_9ASTE|nr:hypothetical protein F0562_017952 [Nyssa sinensis]